jgi:AcrR family transcriptional regulator
MPTQRRADAFRPRKEPRQARSQDTVQAIVRAAAQVFAARGYAASTTNHIAERAGVSIGSLYEYFPNKDALLVALMERHVRDGEAIIAGVQIPLDSDLAGAVRQFVRAMVEFHARDSALHRVLFEEAPLPPLIRRRLTAIETQVTERVRILLENNPEVRRRDTALAAAVVVQTVESLTHKLVLYADAPLEPYVEEMVALLSSYLRTDPAPS